MATDLLGNKLPTYIDFKRYVGALDLDGKELLREQTTPNTPPANTLYLYAKDAAGTSALYFKNDAGTEFQLGSGASIGGTVTGGTTGSVLFVGAGPVLAQDNAHLFWDDTNNFLGIGSATPGLALDIFGTTPATAAMGVQRSNGPAQNSVYRVTGAASANDEFFGFYLGGGSHDGTTANRAGQALLGFYAGETWTSTAKGEYITLETTPTGSVTRVERFRVGPAGQWGIGGATFGTSGQVFTSGGPTAPPTWTTHTIPVGDTVTSGTVGSILFVATGPVLAQNNAKLFWDNSNARLGLGTTGPLFTLHIADAGATSGVLIDSVTTASAPSFVGRGARTSLTSPSAVAANDTLALLGGRGYGATAYSAAVKIAISERASEAWTDGAQGTYFSFFTTATGTTTLAEKFRMEANGDFTLVTTTSKIDLSAITAGSPNLKITATSDTPTVAFTGGGNAPTTAPAGYLEILVGANSRYIPFWA